MRFPRFWARGEHDGFHCWGFSDDSAEEARMRGRERARIVAERFRAGEELGRYGYPDRPLREPILQSFQDSLGKTTGVVTRNSYGCAVLNTACMFIADVDVPDAQNPLNFLRKLFGGGGKESGASPEDRMTTALGRVKEAAAGTLGGLCLIYRTAAGIRVIVADRLIEPSSALAGQLLERMGSDPLYVRLCRNQESFRARLTPKPWRCGYHPAPARWPFVDARSERTFQAWEDVYLERIKDYAVSCLIETVGQGIVHPEIEPLLAVHDQFSRAGRRDLPLA